MSVGPSQSRFLNLPGEIRNRIYYFAVEEELVALRPKSSWDVFYFPPRNRLPYSRQYFSLTRTCRSIRAEYLPLYNKKTRVLVRPKSLYDYINTFLKPAQAANQKLVGRIVVTTRIDTRGETDFLPLYEWVKKSGYITPLAVYLGRLLWISDALVFYKYLKQGVARLGLSCDLRAGDAALFYIKPGYWEDWMEAYGGRALGENDWVAADIRLMFPEWAAKCGMKRSRPPLSIGFTHA